MSHRQLVELIHRDHPVVDVRLLRGSDLPHARLIRAEALLDIRGIVGARLGLGRKPVPAVQVDPQDRLVIRPVGHPLVDGRQLVFGHRKILAELVEVERILTERRPTQGDLVREDALAGESHVEHAVHRMLLANIRRSPAFFPDPIAGRPRQALFLFWNSA